jgi:hypothetical protein
MNEIELAYFIRLRVIYYGPSLETRQNLRIFDANVFAIVTKGKIALFLTQKK